jgi:hypothetical protein
MADWPSPRKRRTLSNSDEDLPNTKPDSIGFQLITILERIESQLSLLEAPLGQRQDNPFQSCLDLYNQSMPGIVERLNHIETITFSSFFLSFFFCFCLLSRKILDRS